MIRRAIRLAMDGRGRVEPNPMVGCVLVRDRQIIGEGFHAQFGGPHAEPNALADAMARGHSPAGATAYVTLEPCGHTNKKTPPCAPRLIAAEIARVVVGCLDPNPAVNGQGAAALRAAGLLVGGPVLETECKQLIAPFLSGISPRRPYVTAKWAESADGKVAGPGGARRQISNGRATRLVHELRARTDVVLVGINTVLTDDPLLTARHAPSDRPRLRVVLDRRLRFPPASRLARTARDVPVIVRCEVGDWYDREARHATLSMLGVDVRPSPQPLTVTRAITDLWWLPGHRTHLLIEPGPTLAAACFAEGVVDRLWVIRSPTAVDDDTAPAAPVVPPDYVRTGTLDLAGDTLTEYLNPESPAYFAPEPSADFILACESAGAAAGSVRRDE